MASYPPRDHQRSISSTSDLGADVQPLPPTWWTSTLRKNGRRATERRASSPNSNGRSAEWVRATNSASLSSNAFTSIDWSADRNAGGSQVLRYSMFSSRAVATTRQLAQAGSSMIGCKMSRTTCCAALSVIRSMPSMNKVGEDEAAISLSSAFADADVKPLAVAKVVQLEPSMRL